MSLIKWTPFIEPSWLEDFDRTLDWPAFRHGFTLALDVYQDKDNVVVEAPLAGIDPEKVEIAIENDVLTIKGESENKSEVEDKNYYRKEVRSGSFYRAVQLPTRVSGEAAQATYDQGILTIKIPKAPEAKPKTIKVNVSK
jgi:HSP20 family protein